MRADLERLVTDLISEENERVESLAVALRAVRSERRRRQVTRIAGLTGLPLVILAFTFMFPRPSTPSRGYEPQVRSAQFIPQTTIEIISDEQLLDLFEEQPVALVGLPGNQRLLLFDREVSP